MDQNARQRKNARRKKRRDSTMWRIASTVSVPRTIFVVFCLLVSGLVEGIGLASLVPLLALASGDSEMSQLGRILVDFLAWFGLQPTPLVLVALLIFGMVGKAALMIVAMQQVAASIARIGTTLRLNLMDALLTARWRFFTREPLGRFANAIGNETYRSGDAFMAVAQFIAHCVHALVYLGIAAVMSWKLAALAALAGFIMVISLHRLVVITKQNARKQSRRMKDMITRLADALIGLKPMKAMARHAQFTALFNKDVRAIERAMRRHFNAKQANRALQDPVTAIFLGVGGYFVLTTMKIPLPELIIMTVLLAKTIDTIGKAQQNLQAVRGYEPSFWMVQDAIDDAAAVREPAHPGLAPTLQRGIVLRDVSISFGSNKVLSQASCVIAAGQVTTITGRSGAGKTTLVDIILGLHQNDSGDIFIDDLNLTQIDIEKWRSMVGYVPQELILFHDTVAVNVTLGDPRFGPDDVERALRQAGAWAFVSALPDGIDHVVGERGNLLSGGQRQRIALARALVHGPKLLVLDEATSALDPETEKMIVDNVCDIARQTGLTVVSITHQPAWVKSADSVIEIEQGVLRQTPEPALTPASVTARALAE